MEHMGIIRLFLETLSPLRHSRLPNYTEKAGGYERERGREIGMERKGKGELNHRQSRGRYV